MRPAGSNQIEPLLAYPITQTSPNPSGKRRAPLDLLPAWPCRKRAKAELQPPVHAAVVAVSHVPSIDSLHDDVILLILMALSAKASSPADLVNAMLTCKRMKKMAMDPQVLAKLGTAGLPKRPERWCEGACNFLIACANAPNTEACYTLGMIYFYCIGNRGIGASLMVRAALAAHPVALQSLAVIHLNGSGGRREDKNLPAGVSLAARSARLGNIDAMRELGHCLQDGYGAPKNVVEGRRILLEANAREAATSTFWHYMAKTSTDCCLLSDYGCDMAPPSAPHLVNKFLAGWFALHPLPHGLRLCSYGGCGRPETRRHEFRRCSACGSVNYCSRACQALHWKAQHKYDCLLQNEYYYNDEHLDEDDEDDDLNNNNNTQEHTTTIDQNPRNDNDDDDEASGVATSDITSDATWEDAFNV